MSSTQALLERLYDEHHQAVLRFARSRDRALAEDVVSETFAVAVRRADAIPEGAEQAWLFAVAENVLRNLQRKEWRAASLPGVLQPYARVIEPPHESATVGPAMNELPPAERAVLTMTALEGLSSAEAGERLGLTPGSTRNVMLRARRRLAIQLAACVILVLAPVLFFALRERGGAQVRQAQQLAQTLRQASNLSTEATVTVGVDRRRYGVTVDRVKGRQRVTLPGGLVAEGRIDEPLAVTAGSGVSAAEARRADRTNARALEAIQLITRGDVERFLAGDARRAGVQERTNGTGEAQTTVVRGELTTSLGRRVELKVVLGGDPAVLRQVRVRRADRADARWTTVDISGWRVVPAAVGGPTPLSPSASSPVSPTTASAGPWAGDDASRERESTPSKTASKRTKGPRPVSAAVARKNRSQLAAVPRFRGSTGAVLHTRSVTVSFKQPGAKNQSRNFSVTAETWEETGGGERYREVKSYFDEDRGRAAGGLESWRSPTVWAVVPRGEDEGRALSSVAIFCRPRDTNQATPSEETEVVDAARGDLAKVPAGPEIRGSATKVVRYEPDAEVARAHGLKPSVFTIYLDAATGVPLRRTYRAGRDARISFRTDYLLWEERPAGGSAAELAGKAPKSFQLRTMSPCAAGTGGAVTGTTPTTDPDGTSQQARGATDEQVPSTTP